MGKLKDYEEMRKLMSEMDVERDYRFTHGSIGMGNPVSMYMSGMLDEGLIKTYPLDTTIKYIKKYFNLSDSDIYPVTTENDNEPQICVLIPKTGNNKELMDKAIGFCGYYCGVCETFPTVLRIQYEQKYDPDNTEEIINDTKFLYHISLSVYESKIRKNGLAPYHRNKRFNYPDRIYLLTDVTMGGYYVNDGVLVDLADMLYQANTDSGTDRNGYYDNDKYTVYKIDVKTLPKGIRFHYDPNMENAIYTQDNIPPTCFVNIGHIDLTSEQITWEKAKR